MTTYFDQNRTYGIEMEVIANPGVSCFDLAAAINAAGIDCQFEAYNHHTRPHWKVTTDASLHGNGFEIVSPILRGDDGLQQLAKVCEAIENIATVNRSCGLHIHHDVSDLDLPQWKNLSKLWMKYEAALETVVPMSRRGDAHWCRRNNRHGLQTMYRLIDDARTLHGLAEAIQSNNRYYKLNMMSYWRQGTVEVRMHSGSTEYAKIANWIKLTQGMINRAAVSRTIKAEGEGKLENVLKNVEPSVRRFYRARAQHFNARVAA